MARQPVTDAALQLAVLRARHDQALAVLTDALKTCRGNRQAADALLDVRLALQGGSRDDA